jgi:hypothetical protein
MIEHAMKIHVFPGGQILVQAGILKHDSKSCPHFMLVAGGIESIDLQSSTRRGQQSGQHLDRGGLASAVWTEKSEDFAARHLKRNIVDCCEVPELLHKVLHANH